MTPLPVDASLTVAVRVTGVPTTTVFVVAPPTRTVAVVGGVPSIVRLAQLPVVSLFGTMSRAYTQIEYGPSARAAVAREPVRDSVTLSKEPSVALMATEEAQFRSPRVKFAPWIGQSPRPASLAVAVTVTVGPGRDRRFDAAFRAAPVTSGGVVSVVSTVRFTHSSCTKSRGFGSDAGSIPAAGAPIPLTAMPVTGSNEV